MSSIAELADFATDVSYDRLPEAVREAVKRRVLDAIAVGIGHAGSPGTDAIRRAITDGSTTEPGRLWGTGLTATPGDAALYNAALTESGNGATFLAPTLAAAHGSIPAVLAAAETHGSPGESVLAGIAVAHEIHGELAWNAPIDGFHPATHGAIAAAAGIGRVLGFDSEQLADAVGLAGARATLAVGDDHDPIAVGSASRAALDACRLADGGVAGPESFGAPDGWHDLVGPFDLDLDSGCERVRDAALRPYDAHPYAQSAIEACIDLAGDVALDPADIDDVTVETFADAVPTLDAVAVAAALVDRELTVRPDERADLQPVVESVDIEADDDLTARVESGEVPARVTVSCRDGSVHEAERTWFTGHPSMPAPWGTIEEKFHALTDDRYGVDRRTAIVDTVRGLEAETAAELSRLLD